MPYNDVDVQREFQRNWKRQHGRKPTPDEKRAHRKAYREKHPEKVKAQSLVGRRVYRKKWPQAGLFSCTDCDNKADQYHHEHYEQPTSVEPLCKSCHYKRHHTK